MITSITSVPETAPFTTGSATSATDEASLTEDSPTPRATPTTSGSEVVGPSARSSQQDHNDTPVTSDSSESQTSVQDSPPGEETSDGETATRGTPDDPAEETEMPSHDPIGLSSMPSVTSPPTASEVTASAPAESTSTPAWMTWRTVPMEEHTSGDLVRQTIMATIPPPSGVPTVTTVTWTSTNHPFAEEPTPVWLCIEGQILCHDQCPFSLMCDGIDEWAPGPLGFPWALVS